MHASREYHVLATRVRDWWYVEVQEFGILAECRRFVEAEAIAREAIAAELVVDRQSFDVSIELRPDVGDAIRRGGHAFVGAVDRPMDGFLHVS